MNKKDLRILITILVMLSLVLAVVLLIVALKCRSCEFKYLLDGKFYTSDSCINNNQITYCKTEEGYIEVEEFYLEV